MKPKRARPSRLPLLSALVLVALALPMRSIAADGGARKTDGGYGEGGAAACLDCHENEHVMGIMETAHFDTKEKDAPAAQRQCQSCHGPSARHMDFPMQVENVHFGKKSNAKPSVQNRACLQCHESGERERWKASAHGFEEVLCSQCHSVHDPKALVPRQAMRIEGCTDACHANLMHGQDPARFSHRVGTDLGSGGTLTCAGCHNPHGPLESSRCLDCHEQTPAVLARQSEKAQRFHATAAERGTECIRCHKEIAHPIQDPELRSPAAALGGGLTGHASAGPR